MGRRPRPYDPKGLTESERIELAKRRLMDETQKALDAALADANICGYGFVALKKLNGSLDATVRHLPWHMVVDVLREMGAIGGVNWPPHEARKT